MVKKFTLGKQERLKRRKIIEQLFKEGKRFTIPPYRVSYLSPKAQSSPPVSKKSPGESSLLQMGVGVSTKNFKQAVDRNRIKRLTREAWRLQKIPLQEIIEQKGEPYAIFIIYTGKELPAWEEVSEKIAVILKRLIKTVNENPATHT